MEGAHFYSKLKNVTKRIVGAAAGKCDERKRRSGCIGSRPAGRHDVRVH